MAEQGKNKRRQLTVVDDVHNVELSVDSPEEIDFVNWCCEAVQLSIINDFEYQPASYELADPVQYIDVNGKTRTMFQGHKYSPDFNIMFDPQKSLILAKEFKITQLQLSCNEVTAVVDVKGTFNKTARSFSVDRKWVWQKFKVYVNEVIPQKFFKICGCPLKSFYTAKTKKARKAFSGFNSLKKIFSIVK